MSEYYRDAVETFSDPVKYKALVAEKVGGEWVKVFEGTTEYAQVLDAIAEAQQWSPE